MKSIAKKILSKKEITLISEIAEKCNATIEELGNYLDGLDKLKPTKREFFTVSLTENEYNMLCERYENFTKNKSNIVRLCLIKALNDGTLNDDLFLNKESIYDHKATRTEKSKRYALNVSFGKKNLKDLQELKRKAEICHVQISVILKWCLLNVIL